MRGGMGEDKAGLRHNCHVTSLFVNEHVITPIVVYAACCAGTFCGNAHYSGYTGKRDEVFPSTTCYVTCYVTGGRDPQRLPGLQSCDAGGSGCPLDASASGRWRRPGAAGSAIWPRPQGPGPGKHVMIYELCLKSVTCYVN